jgi:hypothetical protein
VILVARQIEYEEPDSLWLALEVLQQIKVRPTVVAHRDHFAIHDCAVWEVRKGLGDLGELPIERLLVSRPKADLAAVLYCDGAVAVEFDLPKPVGAVRQVRNRQALHRLDENWVDAR